MRLHLRRAARGIETAARRGFIRAPPTDRSGDHPVPRLERAVASLGQRARNSQWAQSGFRAVQRRRPCQMSQWLNSVQHLRGSGHGMMDFNRLNLTDDQKQKIQTLQTSHKTMMEANKTQMEEMGKLSQLKREGLLTSAQGTRLTALEAQMQTQMKTNMEKMQNDVLAILTPEQKVLVEQMKKQRVDGMKGMRNGGPQQRRGPGGQGAPNGQPKTPPTE